MAAIRTSPLSTSWRARWSKPASMTFSSTNLTLKSEKPTIPRSTRKYRSLFVAVIGRKWLEILHQKRDAGERDVLVREIWSARLKEKPIVPLLVDGAEMPRPIDLPPRIRRFHYQNGVGIKSDDTRQSIAAVLNDASDELKRIHKLLSSWRGAYIAFACVAYFCCAILPHIVGAWEFGSSWVGMAKVWSGFYFWPICFLPFILVAPRLRRLSKARSSRLPGRTSWSI